MRRILVTAASVVLGSLVSVASPAQAASGPWSVVSAGFFPDVCNQRGQVFVLLGGNAYGQIGDGTAGSPGNDRHSPTKIGASGVWETVAAGGNHTCAITTAKPLYCWGLNFSGQIGDGTAITPRTTPRNVP